MASSTPRLLSAHCPANRTSVAGSTWVHSLNVPSEHAVDHRVHHKHGDSKEQIEVISFHWGLAERVPLDAHSCHFIQCKVLGTQAKGCCGHQGRNALLEGSDLVMGYLLADRYIHVGNVAQEVDDTATG